MTYQYIVEGDSINGFLPPGATPSARGFDSSKSIAGPRSFGSLDELSRQWPDIAEHAPADADEKQVFYPLYMHPETGELAVPLSDAVAPILKGSSEYPDAQVKLSLEAFHLPGNDPDARATVRIRVSQDAEFVRGSDILNWVVASGLDLYKVASNGDSVAKQPGEIKADLSKPFLGRPVGLPGGAGYIEISIYGHRERSPLEQIWDSVVSLFKSPAGVALGATVGFPAITAPAVEFFDGLIEKLRQDSDEPIMRTKQLRCALTGRALDDMRLGGQNVFPVLNQGFYVLVPAKHLPRVKELKPRYVGGFGLLKPTVGEMKDVSNEDFIAKFGKGDYPFADVSYAVLSLRTKEFKIPEYL